MNAPASLSTMFQNVGLSYGWSMPVLLLIGLALLSVAISRDGGTAAARTRALYCHLMEFIGVLLMTAGALPALYAVFSLQPLSQITYVGLLLVFAAGGLLFLWHDARLGEIDPAARETADALFLNAWKLMGMLVVIFTGLSLLLRVMLASDHTNGWWVMHLTMFLYGLVLCWFTLHRHKPVQKAPAARPVLFAKKTAKPAARKR
jgi:hypothetical protein